MSINTPFRRQIALPQDHGSWVFLFSPLAIGLAAGQTFNPSSAALICTAIAAFLIRQPITMMLKAYSGRRPRTDLPAARFWTVFYGLFVLGGLTALVLLKQTYILFLGVPAIPVFAWHLYLVSRREERRQAGVEILATGVLALAAPAAYWIGQGKYLPSGWMIWILTWFQSAASIVYAYLRLEQRGWKTHPSLRGCVSAGWRSMAYTIFNLCLAAGLGAFGAAPRLIALAFVVQAAEAAWGTFRPAIGAKPTSVGFRQLFVSILFTIVFILTWR